MIWFTGTHVNYGWSLMFLLPRNKKKNVAHNVRSLECYSRYLFFFWKMFRKRETSNGLIDPSQQMPLHPLNFQNEEKQLKFANWPIQLKFDTVLKTPQKTQKLWFMATSPNILVVGLDYYYWRSCRAGGKWWRRTAGTSHYTLSFISCFSKGEKK